MELFKRNGVHIVADGQFGSTGKGALAAWIAGQAFDRGFEFGGCITSAGPNSGHTSYFQGEKVVLKQLPTFAVISHMMGHTIPVYFSAGAIIDPAILSSEMSRFPGIPVFVHPCAAVVTQADKDAEHSGTIAAVAGTRSGTGSALARKVMRDPDAVVGYRWGFNTYEDTALDCYRRPYFMEISQGFSLGINSAQFYPKGTSRECTFMQGMADARIPARYFSRGYLSFRTLPIRVGNVDGFDSGGWYRDQHELDWEKLGLDPERTTVTNRIRRIASWSWDQFNEALRANEPTHVFLNFLNYLDGEAQKKFLEDHRAARRAWNNVGRPYYEFLCGYGETIDDIVHG